LGRIQRIESGIRRIEFGIQRKSAEFGGFGTFLVKIRSDMRRNEKMHVGRNEKGMRKVREGARNEKSEPGVKDSTG
jgi:hypothetical protein